MKKIFLQRDDIALLIQAGELALGDIAKSDRADKKMGFSPLSKRRAVAKALRLAVRRAKRTIGS